MAKAGPRRPTQTGDDLGARLVEATIRVLVRDGFTHASGRTIATEAGTVNGSIFYYFGSMDGLLAATARTLADRGIERIRLGLGGDDAHLEWPDRLPDVLRSEAEGDDGKAVMELLVGARTSPELAEEVRRAIDRAIGFARTELDRVLDGTVVAGLVPGRTLAELAAATFLGLEVLIQSGREIDLDELVALVATAVRLAAGLGPGPGDGPGA